MKCINPKCNNNAGAGFFFCDECKNNLDALNKISYFRLKFKKVNYDHRKIK